MTDHPPFDAIVDSRAVEPIIYHADFARDDRREDAMLVAHGAKVYPTIQAALDDGRESIFVRPGVHTEQEIRAERAKGRRRKRRAWIVDDAEE